MLFTLNRDFVLVTLAGRSYGFKKGVPLEIPAAFAAQAVAIGAEPAPENAAEVAQIKASADAAQAELQGRGAKIEAAIRIFIERNMPGDFTAGGRPNLKKLAAEVGFEVERDEMEEAFASVKQKIEAGM